MGTFQTLPGFREFYPEDLARRNRIFAGWRKAARAFGFAEYDAPVLEPLDLYKAKSGSEIEEQLFAFTDKGGREVALRPEMTPTVCRLVGERAGALKRPIKWFSIAEFYRYERMQKGRGRCFFQFNADIFGEPGPEAEIELIALLIQCFVEFGLSAKDFHVRLSDRNIWIHYLEALGFDGPRIAALLVAVDKYDKIGDEAFKGYSEQFGAVDDAIKHSILTFLKIRSLEGLKKCAREIPGESIRAGAKSPRVGEPDAVTQLLGRLKDWDRLLSGLAHMGLSDYISVDLGVVRGLAYYTGFVFEAFDRKGELRALAGGGRYNDLVEKLGGPSLPAIGFAIGDMTFSLLLERRGLTPKPAEAPDIYVVTGGEQERREAFAAIAALRAAGRRVEYGLKEIAFGKQFKAAAESGARLALIYGSEELARGVVKVRDLAARTERDVAKADLTAAVGELLG